MLFYDVFHAGDARRIICLGPPLLNCEEALSEVVFRVPAAKEATIWKYRPPRSHLQPSCQFCLMGPEVAAAATTKEVSSTERPSIAVLPFANMSGDPEQEYFADGISEDIIGKRQMVGKVVNVPAHEPPINASNSKFALIFRAPDGHQCAPLARLRTIVRKIGQAFHPVGCPNDSAPFGSCRVGL
jgi:hypothetical protein